MNERPTREELFTNANSGLRDALSALATTGEWLDSDWRPDHVEFELSTEVASIRTSVLATIAKAVSFFHQAPATLLRWRKSTPGEFNTWEMVFVD